MENTSTKLSFPQRNWFLLCVIVAILSPLVVHWVQGGARKEAYNESINTRPAGSDTSYKVASPPMPASDTAGKGAAGGGSDTSHH